MTATRNFTVRAGNSGTVDNATGIQVLLRVYVNDVLTPEDLTGDAFVFRVWSRGAQVLRLTTADAITVDLVTAQVTVPLSVANSRTLESAGPALTYDLERRPLAGGQRTVIFGAMIVEPGCNDD